MGHSISEIVRQLGFSRLTISRVYQEYLDGGQKTSDQANCKGQLALTVLDNCTSHTYRLTTGWLDEHSSDFSVLKWLSISPDLSPIELLWDVLEQSVRSHNTAPATLAELWAALA
ncbi:transposable element Tcb2 transposase [Trichonephila clavipes]|nr:transposable element Tcb2 transposase [Trichonephila clavipes]